MEHQIECEKCGKKFSSKESLEQHFNAKHIQSHAEHKKTRKKMPVLKYSIIAILIIVGIILLSRIFESNAPDSSSNQLYPANSITHAHGLAVDVADSSKLYIATHHGLLVLLNDKELYAVGKSIDDYMGFTPHPANSQILFSSGHPSRGGNIGFQMSEDGGFNWKKVSLGFDGPVDFHAMAISPANPNIVYGWYKGTLQRSDNVGKSWKIINSNLPQIVFLAAHPKDENIVYAATIKGLMASKDKGLNWDYLSDNLKGFITLSGFAVNPQNPSEMISYSGKLGLAKSADGGITWRSIGEKFNGETPLYLAYDKQNPKNVYTVTEKQKIYKSTDEGNTWSAIY